MENVEMLVAFNDPQLLNNADDEAIGAFLQFIEHYRLHITHIVFNGDILDMEQANKFSLNSKMVGGMQDEIVAGKWLISRITELLPDSSKIFIYGNHEDRVKNYTRDRFDGVQEWLKTFEEMFEFDRLGWDTVHYGKGQYYKWHDRIFWHGKKAGAKSNIPKLEFQDALVSTTTAHINRNMYHEERNAFGRTYRSMAHGGFSRDNLDFMKTANTKWSQGFGVYYWSESRGEQPYMVIMDHGNPKFIWEGRLFDGTGFNLRREIGLEELEPYEVKIKSYGNIVVFPRR